MTPSPLLEVHDLTVRFLRRRQMADMLSGRSAFQNAVDGVNLVVNPGEVLGIVGESGSGKTTLGKALLGLIRPHSGEIRFRGADITGLSERSMMPLRRHMQMVFQDPLSSLNPRHSIRRALLTPLRNYGVGAADQVDQLIDTTLSRVGLPASMKTRFPHEMSGGQLQRIAIGRALIVSPSLIIADEPVSKLDVSVRAKILNLFKDVQRSTGVALIFITHDLRIARYLCDRICVMYFGKIIESGSARELFEKPAHPYTRALVGTLATHAEGGNAQRERAVPVPDSPACRFYDHCAIRENKCRLEQPPMKPLADTHAVACHKVA